MDDVDAFTVKEFCQRHRVSRAKFYRMLKAGTAPRTMKVDARRKISTEAAADWRRRLEEATAAGLGQ